VHEVLDQVGNVLTTFAQRWEREWHYVKPVKEIRAESSLFD
jgi:hypothetical protein